MAISFKNGLSTIIAKLASYTNASPANGDLWFDGTNFKAREGGVTKNLISAGGVSFLQFSCAENIYGYETRYITGSNSGSSEITAIAWIAPVSCVLSNLSVRIHGSQPNQNLVVTIKKNGSNTDLVLTIPPYASTDVYQNNTDTVTIDAGSRISVKVYNDGADESATIRNVAVKVS